MEKNRQRASITYQEQEEEEDNDPSFSKIENILISEGREFTDLFQSRLETIHRILSSHEFSIHNIYEANLWESKPPPCSSSMCDKTNETDEQPPPPPSKSSTRFVRILFPIAFSNRQMIRDTVQAVSPNPQHPNITNNYRMDKMEKDLYKLIVILSGDIGRIRRYAELKKSKEGTVGNEKFYRVTISNLNVMEELVNNEVDKWCTTHLSRTDLIHRTHKDIDDSVLALKMYDLKAMLNLRSTAGRLLDMYIDLNDIAQSITIEDNFANDLFRHLYT